MSGAAETTDVATLPDPMAQPPEILHRALMESRQRWRQFGALASDMVFETDAHGDLTFMAPEDVLGWSASELIGRPAHSLLLDQAAPDVFAFITPQHRRHTWFQSRAEGPACMALTIVPMQDEHGQPCGVRGVAVNVTEQERAGLASAAALRRSDVLDHILGRMRQEVLAPRIMQTMLDSLMRAVGAQGAAIVDLQHGNPSGAKQIMHLTGGNPERLLESVHAALDDGSENTTVFDITDGTQAMATPCSTRFGDRAALMTWRAPGARAWDADDMTLSASIGGVVRIVLEHEAIQRELARQARTDPLTGLLNRRAFMEEASRRLDRLERDGVPGTLLFLDLDRFKQLNDQKGHDVGDAALVVIGELLHRTFRSSDLVARLGGDEFAVWMDGTDSLSAAERAEVLRLATPQELAHLSAGDSIAMSMSIGIATREAGSDEMLDQVIQRADQAMYQVKRTGRGHWQVSHLEMAR